MATRKIVTLVCDFCGTEKNVENHEVTIDRETYEGDACPKCWKGYRKGADSFFAVGRRVRRKYRKRKQADA